MAKNINVKARLPMANDHYGFKFLDIDFEGRLHPGVDFNGPGGGNSDKGTPLHPILPGVCSFVSPLGQRNFGWGNLVYIRHDMKEYFAAFGLEVPEWCPDKVWSQYAHCNEVFVKEGDEVSTDDVIATLGGTGGWSAHLHHEVRKRTLGVWYYPSTTNEAYIRDRYFNPEHFVRDVNMYVAEGLENMTDNDDTIVSTLIKAVKKPEIYVFNGTKRFHIPDEETALLLFGPDYFAEVQEITSRQLKKITNGEPIPSMK